MIQAQHQLNSESTYILSAYESLIGKVNSKKEHSNKKHITTSKPHFVVKDIMWYYITFI